MYFMIPPIEVPQICGFIETDSRMEVNRMGWDKEEWKVIV